MCEIISAGTQSYNSGQHTNYAMQVYEAMGDSLGILALQDCGSRFEYEVFRSTDPQEWEVADFIGENFDTTDLFVHHGRLATEGAVTKQHAHPLEIDCEQCDVDYVIHNGVMWGHQHTRNQFEDAGHEFTTNVDSEVIAHSHRDVPTEFEGGMALAHFKRQPAYILANENSLYITTNGAYHLTRFGEMAKSYRGVISSDRERYDEVILTPTNDN